MSFAWRLVTLNAQSSEYDMNFLPRDDMGHVGCDTDPYLTPLDPFWIDMPLEIWSSTGLNKQKISA